MVCWILDVIKNIYTRVLQIWIIISFNSILNNNSIQTSIDITTGFIYYFHLMSCWPRSQTARHLPEKITVQSIILPPPNDPINTGWSSNCSFIGGRQTKSIIIISGLLCCLTKPPQFFLQFPVVAYIWFVWMPFKLSNHLDWSSPILSVLHAFHLYVICCPSNMSCPVTLQCCYLL